MTDKASDTPFPLRGLKVVEWGDFVAAPYATRLLADAGAEVVKVEPPEGDSARREGPFPEDRPDPERSGLFAYLNRGKRSVVLDVGEAAGRRRLLDLIGAADVFVHDRVSLAASQLGIGAEELRSTNPRLVVVSVTPFGESGPRAGQKADDLIVVASSGLAFSTPGFPDFVRNPEVEPPLHPNARLGELMGGVAAASGALHALLQRDRTGEGDTVEVSNQEALTGMWIRELATYSYGGTLMGRHPGRANNCPNNYMPVADGWAAVVAFTEPHWRTFLGLMGNPEWAQDPRFATGRSRSNNWEALEPLLQPWLNRQTGKALLKLTQERGVPCAPAFPIADAVGNEQVAARGYLVPSGVPGDESGRLPGSVYVVDGRRVPAPSHVPALGEHTEAVLEEWVGKGAARHTVAHREILRSAQDDNRKRGDNRKVLPLSGVRVVDLGQFLAIPLTGQILAFLGAEVIMVESRAHPSRSTLPFAGSPSPNTSGIFNHANRNKRSCTLNLRTPEGVALVKRLIATADLVLENFSPGTMEKIGIGYETLRQIKPDLVLVSLSACGSTGPWRNYSGLHTGIMGLSGMAAVTGYPGGHPRLVGSYLPDPVSAAYCALGATLAVYHRRRTGRGQHLEVAMTEVLQSLIPEAILEYTMLGREVPRIGNRHRWKAPHGIYRSLGDDRWLALSVSNEEEWGALGRVMGRPELAADPRFAGLAERQAAVQELEAIIAEWTRTMPPEEAAERLQAAGVPASPVLNARDLLVDAHLLERGFIREDHHPEAGPRPMPVAPWRFGEIALEYRSTPLLAADNGYVFGEILGMPAEEIRRLEEARVIY